MLRQGFKLYLYGKKKKIKEPVLAVILKNSKIGELEELVTNLTKTDLKFLGSRVLDLVLP